MKRSTRVDEYKRYLKCQHDGEVVLKAGEHCFFPDSLHCTPSQSKNNGTSTNCFQSHELLSQMGIKTEMTATEIVALIRRRLDRMVIDEKHPTGQQEIVTLLKSVVDFCEEPIIEKDS